MSTFEEGKKTLTNKEYAYQYYLNKGLTPIMSSAIVGNLIKESGLNPSIIGKADNKGSIGIAQWHSGRLDNLKRFAGNNWKSLDSQLDFVLHELNTTERGAFDKLKRAKTVEEATTSFMNEYERPSSNPKINRINERITEALSIAGMEPQQVFSHDMLDTTVSMDAKPVSLETSTTEYKEPEDLEVTEAKKDIEKKSFQEDLLEIISRQTPIQQPAQQQQQTQQNDLPDPYNYIQQDPGYNFEEYQDGGKVTKDFLVNWYTNRRLPDNTLNEVYQKEKPLYIEKARTVQNPNYVDKIGDDGETLGLYHQDTGAIDVLKGSDPLVYTHEASHAINMPLQNTESSLTAFIETEKNIIPEDKVQDKWIKEHYKELSNYNEVIPRLNSYRQLHGLKPDQVITPELIKENRESYNKGTIPYEANTEQLYQLFEDEGLSNVLNKIVSSDTNPYKHYAQDGGSIPVSENGVYEYPMQEVIVPTQEGRITMSKVDYPIVGISMETGEQQLMMPEGEYAFQDTKNVFEIPQFQNAGTFKLKDEILDRRVVKETIPDFVKNVKIQKQETFVPDIDTLKRIRPDIKDDQGIYFGQGNDTTYVSPGNALKEVVIKAYKKPSEKIDTSNITDAKEIQQKLVDFGYDLGNYGEKGNGVDGKIGKRTKQAINSYNEIVGYQEEYKRSGSKKKVEDFIIDKLGDRNYNKRELELFRDSSYLVKRPELIDEDVKRQVEANKKSGVIDSDYLVISDKNSRGYVFDKDNNLIKSFKTVTGRDSGEDTKINSKKWVEANPGKSFKDYIEYLDKTGQKYTPSGVYFVGKKDKTYSELKAGSVLGEAALEFNKVFRPQEIKRREAAREHSYGDVGLIGLKRLSGEGLGEAIHSTGTEERTKNLNDLSMPSDRKMSSGCVNVGDEDLGFCFKELKHNTPVFLLREDEKILSPEVLKFKNASKKEREVVNNLYNNYEKLKKDFGEDTDKYINYATGILGNESNFGHMSVKGNVKEALAKNSLIRKITGAKGDASIGAAQIKWSSLSPQVREKLKRFNITTPDDLEDTGKASIAAMYLLKNKAEKEGDIDKGIKSYLGATSDNSKTRHYIRKVKD